jgi:hypothetical protein
VKRTLFSLLCVLPLISSAQQRNSHQVFWLRAAIADNLSDKLRCEFVYQKRTQNNYSSDPNLFHSFQFESYVLTLQHTINKKFTLGISPIGFYKSHPLNISEADRDRPIVKEFRWAGQLVHEVGGRYVDFNQRFSVDYRLRDLQQHGEYTGNWRLRYLVRLDKSVFGLLSPSKPVTFTISDEIFFQFGKAVKNNAKSFDQNRLYGGASYEIFNNVSVSLGYAYGFQIRSSGDQYDDINSYILGLTYNNFIGQFIKSKNKTKGTS